MDAIDMLLHRRSCRQFTDEQISDADLTTVVDCGLAAPTGMNQQSTKIVIVQEPEKIKLLSKLNATIMNTDSDPFYGAPTVCLILTPKVADYNANSMSLNPMKDGSLVIGAMQNAAYALGLGSCWINRCKEMLLLPEGQKILKELGLEDYEGVGCVALGKPKHQASGKKIKPGRVIRW